MKKYKDFIVEMLEPNCGDEARFIAKHGLVVWDYTIGNDDMFNGTVKDYTRIADYKNGADKVVYEGCAEIKQKIPFDDTVGQTEVELLRRKKQEIKQKIIDEGVEDLDELYSLIEDFDADDINDLLQKL